jgi:hypothetical protein
MVDLCDRPGLRILVAHLDAYSTGLAFDVVAAGDLLHDVDASIAGALRVEVEYPDGRRAASDDPWIEGGASPPAEMVLSDCGWAMWRSRVRSRWFLWPLPGEGGAVTWRVCLPPGCEEEVTGTLDSAVVHDAVGQARRLWGAA